MKISIVISSRDEMPNVVHTVHSIINDLETFLEPDDWEIILVDNGSRNKDSWRYLAMRGLYYHRNVKILHDPIMGNVSARNKGAEIANGEYLFFSDAHMSYKIGTFKKLVEAIDESGGIAHPAVEWMGGYYPSEPSYQYTLKLGEKIYGTWNRLKISDDWFYITLSGHCCLGMKRQQFLDFKGYNPYFRCYGGGEVYLDMKWYMLGSCSVVVPQAKGYHLSYQRGYSYHADDLLHNMILLGYALGGSGWGERVYIRYLGKKGINFLLLDKLNKEAIKEAEEDTLVKDAKVSFNDLITERPWDKMNIERHGKANSAMVIFDETWTKELTGKAKELYNRSPLQKKLKERIDNEWAYMIYKGK